MIPPPFHRGEIIGSQALLDFSFRYFDLKNTSASAAFTLDKKASAHRAFCAG
jgi:hypothetical protein